jgi:hypothetical protein
MKQHTLNYSAPKTNRYQPLQKPSPPSPHSLHRNSLPLPPPPSPLYVSTNTSNLKTTTTTTNNPFKTIGGRGDNSCKVNVIVVGVAGLVVAVVLLRLWW